MVDTSLLDRRTVLSTTAGLATLALAGCSASGDDGNGGAAEFDGWFDGVSNYDGVADRTGKDAVEVTVGAKGNDGNFAFDPAAVRVSAGTTVVWKWNGKGSLHNVVADDGSFESEMYGTAGETFERAFEREGTYKYYCAPHKSSGMKGVVVVE
jgi:halocyanin-like protein